MTFNLYPEKIISGLLAGVVGAFTENLFVLVCAAAIFEIVDFITGCWKSGVEAKAKGEKFAFESTKAWRTIYKAVFILVGIVLAEMLDDVMTENRLRLANYFTAFVCGVEFWSFLENAAVISDYPIFRWLRKFMKTKVEKELDTTFEENE